MNNLKQLSQKEEFLRGANWLYEHDIERFHFLDNFINAIVNKETISVEMSLNSEIHTVSVRIGEYMYKEEFDTLDKAMVLVDLVRSVKKEVA